MFECVAHPAICQFTMCQLSDRLHCVMNAADESILSSEFNVLFCEGLAQCAELSWQLRGEAGKRQVDGARVAMQHNFGIGGAAVVTMYRKYGQQLTSKL